MKKQTGTQSMTQHVRNEAEGSPDKYEFQDPPSPSRRRIKLDGTVQTVHPEAGETGLIPMVKLHEFDEHNDGQDASLTTGETTLNITTNMDTVMMSATTDVTQDVSVLVVEDTVELAEVIQATLEGLGMKVDHATHGKMGLEKLKLEAPRVLLLDIGLPDITGWKMLEEVKEHYASNDMALPITIIITAYGDPANRLVGKLQNIYTYLIKPFTPDEVEKVVKRALSGDTSDESSLGG